ncbi:hypothetical protein SAMN05421819_1925 [Bryocella elongata]|uniref:Uncharacterized protein n=1 Tax=Bryocella elongata TaxID=863522 RepID=A0A1H5XR98_9BACT|nr:hypothetical protein [Bryocella elongata]SEG13967.1 hypothetical protein SAMN05421819_1925 [Bryocella elongata]
MIKAVSVAALLIAVCPPVQSAFGQAPPAVTYDAPSTGFSLPLAGQLTYAVNGGETAYVNYAGYSGTAYATQMGATVGILTGSSYHPFSLLYGGGVTFFSGGQGNSSYYQSLDMSQQLVYEKWTFIAEDTLRITPDLPLGGVSGTAGAGDLGNGTAGGDAAGLLTPNQTRLNESAQGSAQRMLSGATSLNMGVGYTLLHFPGGGTAASGIDSSSLNASGGVTHHLSGRDQIGGNYSYIHTSQPSTGFTVNTQSARMNVTHSFSPTWTASAGAGPQFFTSAAAGLSSSSLSYSVQASVDHELQFSSMNLSFDREILNTASYGSSAETARLGFGFSRSISPVMHASANMSYLRTTSLPGVGTYAYNSNGFYLGAQVNRTLSRLWSAYFSYTLEDQSVTGLTGGPAPLQGIQHLVGFGVTFAPLPISLHGH